MTISQFGILGGYQSRVAIKDRSTAYWKTLPSHQNNISLYHAYIICHGVSKLQWTWFSPPGFRTFSLFLIYFLGGNHSYKKQLPFQVKLSPQNNSLASNLDQLQSSLGPWSKPGVKSTTKRTEHIGFCLNKWAFNWWTCGLSKTTFQFPGVQHHLMKA